MLPAEAAAPGPGTAKHSHAMRYLRRLGISTVMSSGSDLRFPTRTCQWAASQNAISSASPSRHLGWAARWVAPRCPSADTSRSAAFVGALGGSSFRKLGGNGARREGSAKCDGALPNRSRFSGFRKSARAPNSKSATRVTSGHSDRLPRRPQCAGSRPSRPRVRLPSSTRTGLSEPRRRLAILGVKTIDQTKPLGQGH